MWHTLSWYSIYKKVKDPGENTMKLDSFSWNICDLCFPNILLSISIILLAEIKTTLTLHKFLKSMIFFSSGRPLSWGLFPWLYRCSLLRGARCPGHAHEGWKVRPLALSPPLLQGWGCDCHSPLLFKLFGYIHENEPFSPEQSSISHTMSQSLLVNSFPGYKWICLQPEEKYWKEYEMWGSVCTCVMP